MKRFYIRNVKKAWALTQSEWGGHLVSYVNGVTGYVRRRQRFQNPPKGVIAWFVLTSDGKASSIIFSKTV